MYSKPINRAAMMLMACMLAFLAACASIGAPTPQTFNERLAAGYTTVTGVRQAATVLLTSQRITAADAQNVQNQADTARAGLDVAKSMSGTNLPAADTKLTATLTVLQALQAYLVAHQ
jgi:hypothetical protein